MSGRAEAPPLLKLAQGKSWKVNNLRFEVCERVLIESKLAFCDYNGVVSDAFESLRRKRMARDEMEEAKWWKAGCEMITSHIFTQVDSEGEPETSWLSGLWRSGVFILGVSLAY